ncbi:MAG: MFS transporter [Alphaproteobacteria bacterium]|nr:MFS transporter [Alphaproteobacteria bacterium]
MLFLARIGLGFQFQTLGSVGDDLVGAFGLDYAEIGTLVGMFMLPGLFLAIPAGFSGRYVSDRILGGLGLAALALGGLVSGLADGPWLIGVGRAVSGVGFLFSTLYFTKMVADWFVGKEIATAMGILVMSWPFGIAMGQIGHESLAATINWRWPFFIASTYCAMGALAVLLFYRPPHDHGPAQQSAETKLSREELRLTIIASAVWGVFNAGYVVYLNFGPLMLEANGYAAIEAAAVISIGSWIMILSGAACGQIADRTKKPDLVLYVCMVGAMGSMALLAVNGAEFAVSLAFGLIGMAPAGVIMALTGEAMRPERRAFGMGVFFTGYYLVMAVSPPIAGWLFDVTADPYTPVLFGIGLFGAVIAANMLFRQAKANRLTSRG